MTERPWPRSCSKVTLLSSIVSPPWPAGGGVGCGSGCGGAGCGSGAGGGGSGAGGCGVGAGRRLRSWRRRRGWRLRLRRGASLDRSEHGLLGFDRPALGLAGALLGLGDAGFDLAQALLALVLLRLQLRQALGLGGAPFGRLRPLLDLAQALLRFGQRALLRFPLLLEAVFGGLHVGRRRRRSLRSHRRRGWRWNRAHALRRLTGLRLRAPRLRLALQPLGLLDATIRLGADPLLLALDLGDLVLHPLFGGGGVVSLAGGRRWSNGRRRGRRHAAAAGA